jgi:hypothetical protein
MSAYPPYQQPPGMPPPPGTPGWPPQPGPPEQPVQRRSGCRGCFITCLLVLVGCLTLAVIVVAVGVYMVRQAAPNATTIEQSVTCAILRGAITVGDQAIEQGEGTEAQKAELRRGLQDLRTQFQSECGPLP